MESRENNKNSGENPSSQGSPVFSPANTVAIYTVLRVLIKMRDSLGLEAMHEYMAKYLSIMEAYNPKMQEAVSKALTVINVEKIYVDAMQEKI